MRPTEPEPELVVRVASLGRRARRRRLSRRRCRVAEGRVPERGSTRSATASRYAEVRDRLPATAATRESALTSEPGRRRVPPGIRRDAESRGRNRQPHRSEDPDDRPRRVRRLFAVYARNKTCRRDLPAGERTRGRIRPDRRRRRRRRAVATRARRRSHVAEKLVRLDLGGAPRGAQSSSASGQRSRAMNSSPRGRVPRRRRRSESSVRFGPGSGATRCPLRGCFRKFSPGSRRGTGNPDQQLEHHRAERPPVHLGTVRLAHQHLGREVIRRALRHPRPGVFTRARPRVVEFARAHVARPARRARVAPVPAVAYRWGRTRCWGRSCWGRTRCSGPGSEG